jgi:DNA-binding MarR family transcriptional regulator/N-acetylglutamate synthase-like GNAT family acetyltransferase
MINDILVENPYLLLGSRLKRLSERFLTDAAKIHHNHDFALFPSQCVMLAQIADAGAISVAQIAEILRQSQPAVTRNLNGLRQLGLIKSKSVKGDNRVKLISLTDKGHAQLKILKRNIWSSIDGVIRDLLTETAPDFIDSITAIEKALDQNSFEARFNQRKNRALGPDDFEIVDYSDAYAADFYRINAQWILENFVLEPTDIAVLSRPREAILDAGGAILLCNHPTLGIVGTVALMKMPDGAFELTKMAIVRDLRGLKIGERLLKAALARAKTMTIETLFLLTNTKQEAAIHLYEKLGFVHSQAIMDSYGHEFVRCNVAMKYAG